MRRDYFCVELGSLENVRLHEELATAFEQTRHLVQEDVAHDETLLVPLLPPRIGEVEERTAHTMIGTETRKRDARIFAEHARTRGMTGLGETRVTDDSPLLSDLEAEQRCLGLGERALDEKARLGSRTDFDLEPCTAHDRRDLDTRLGLRLREGRETRSMFVRAAHAARIDARA